METLLEQLEREGSGEQESKGEIKQMSIPHR